MNRMRPVLFLAAVAWLTGCSRTQPNVVLITFDTTRADHVGYAKGAEGVTPNLDALAARGTWFSQAITVQPLTLPAHTSIMTGLYPFHHKVRNNGTYIVPPETVTLAERLKDAGYATQAMISSFVLDSQFGLDQGFDDYDDDLSGGAKQKMFMFKELPAEKRADRAIEWLQTKRPKDRPFFLWLHFFDPHADYQPPLDIATLFAGDPYSGEIHYADRELGRVLSTLQTLQLTDDTLFVFTADHGDGLGEHGEKTHGMFIYDSTTRVPLLLAGPGVPEGQKVDALARSVDIVPTVLDLLGLPEASGLDGLTLRSLWDGEDLSREAYVETMLPRMNFGWSELRALRSGQSKVIQAPRPEEYALEADPNELNNLQGQPSGAPGAVDLRFRLQALIEKDPLSRGEQQEVDIDEETRARLTALGYVWSASAFDPNDQARPDPKDRIHNFETFQTAQTLLRQGRRPEAIQLIETLLKSDEKNVMAMGSLAGALLATGEKQKALAVYRKMIELDTRNENPFLGASKILRESGEFAEAEQLAQYVVKMQPKNPEGYASLGDLYLEQQDFQASEYWFRKALAVDPHSSLAISGLGNCFQRANRLKDALKVLRNGYRQDRTSLAITYNLAVVSEKLGDVKAAQALYQEAIALDPDHSLSWNNLGSLLDRLGQRAEAIQKIAKAHELEPQNLEATFNLGVLLLLQGDPTQALPLLDQTLKMDPNFIRAYQFKVQALMELERYDEAIELWKSLSNRSPAIWLHIARIELKRGQPEAARQAIQSAIAKGGDPMREAAAADPALSPLLPPSSNGSPAPQASPAAVLTPVPVPSASGDSGVVPASGASEATPASGSTDAVPASTTPSALPPADAPDAAPDSPDTAPASGSLDVPPAATPLPVETAVPQALPPAEASQPADSATLPSPAPSTDPAPQTPGPS